MPCRLQCSSVEYAGFDVAVDEYFAAVERDRSTRAGEADTSAARKKTEKKLSGMDCRVQELEEEVARTYRCALAIMSDAESVHRAIETVVGEARSNRKWKEVEEGVRARAAQGDATAAMVYHFDRERTCLSPSSPRVRLHLLLVIVRWTTVRAFLLTSAVSQSSMAS